MHHVDPRPPPWHPRQPGISQSAAMNASSEGESFPGSVQSKCFSGRSARSGAQCALRGPGPSTSATQRAGPGPRNRGDGPEPASRGPRRARGAGGARVGLGSGHPTQSGHPTRWGALSGIEGSPGREPWGRACISDNRQPLGAFPAPPAEFGGGFGVTAATLMGNFCLGGPKSLKSGGSEDFTRSGRLDLQAYCKAFST